MRKRSRADMYREAIGFIIAGVAGVFCVGISMGLMKNPIFIIGLIFGVWMFLAGMYGFITRAEEIALSYKEEKV